MECPSCGKLKKPYFLIHPPQFAHGGLRIKLFNPAFFHSPLLQLKQTFQTKISFWVLQFFLLFFFFSLFKTPAGAICCRCYGLICMTGKQADKTLEWNGIYQTCLGFKQSKVIHTCPANHKKWFRRNIPEKRLRQKEKRPVCCYCCKDVKEYLGNLQAPHRNVEKNISCSLITPFWKCSADPHPEKQYIHTRCSTFSVFLLLFFLRWGILHKWPPHVTEKLPRDPGQQCSTADWTQKHTPSRDNPSVSLETTQTMCRETWLEMKRAKYFSMGLETRSEIGSRGSCVVQNNKADKTRA